MILPDDSPQRALRCTKEKKERTVVEQPRCFYEAYTCTPGAKAGVETANSQVLGHIGVQLELGDRVDYEIALERIKKETGHDPLLFEESGMLARVNVPGISSSRDDLAIIQVRLSDRDNPFTRSRWIRLEISMHGDKEWEKE